MYTNQQKFVPRWKEWVPLATQQFRLRNLLQILAMNVGAEDLEGKICKQSGSKSSISYYYTFHSTALSAPFYTSEQVESDCPKWKEISSSVWMLEGVQGYSDALVIRLWSHRENESEDELITVWGVRLTGLICIGQHLGVDWPAFNTNTIIFYMPGGYYTNPENVAGMERRRFNAVNVAKEEVRLSYDILTLERLQKLQKARVQKTEAAKVEKQRILSGDFVTSESRGSAMLRRLLSKNKPKSSYADIAKIKESIEIARFRVLTLAEEKKKLFSKIVEARKKFDLLSDKNSDLESQIMENYRLLQRQVDAHREWLKGHNERREEQLHCRAILNLRMKILISELSLIYPIERNEANYTICQVHLPDSESFAGHDDLKVSVGLGFVAHTVHMVSAFLQVPLRYPIIHAGSRSRIIDNIADKIPDSEREFPLFCKSKDKLPFNYAVFLLNKDIAQLRLLCGLHTNDLRCTLSNLSSLLKLTGPDEFVEIPQRSLSSPTTLDLNSSSFSLPMSCSPGDRYFTPRRNLISHRVSESAADLLPTRENENVPGHRASKSVGSASDFELPPPSPKPGPSGYVPSLSCNLSYSLDKGLNEFEEIKRMTERVRIENVSEPSAVPFNLGGSESSLPACLPRKVSLKESGSPGEDATTSAFLKDWEADKSNVILSDEDAELNNSGIFVGKTAVVETNIKTCPRELDSAPTNVEKTSSTVLVDSCSHNALDTSQPPYTLEDHVCVGQEASDVLPRRCSDAVEAVVPEKNPVLHEVTEKDVDSIVEHSPADPLLENVTNRAEVLASQSSSFNTFRSRFKSTLGSSN